MNLREAFKSTMDAIKPSEELEQRIKDKVKEMSQKNESESKQNKDVNEQ